MMKMHRMAAFASALLLAAVVGCTQQPADSAAGDSAAAPAETASDATPASATPASTESPLAATAGSEEATPGQSASTTKLVAPARGEVELGYTKPSTRREGNMVITTFKVKNLASAPIAGLRIDEFWYDKGGNPVAGAPTFRHRKPLQPGEVIDVELRTPVNPAMNQPQWQFEHANGKIKPVLTDKM